MIFSLYPGTLQLGSIAIQSPHVAIPGERQLPEVMLVGFGSKIYLEVEQVLFLMPVFWGAVTQQHSFHVCNSKKLQRMNQKRHTQPTPKGKELDFKQLFAIWIKFVLYTFFSN